MATTLGRIDRESTLEEEIAEAQATLASHGIMPGPDGGYDEATLRDAIHARGWTYRLEEGDDGWWGAEVRQDLSPTRSIFGVASGKSGDAALLLALQIMLAADPDEANAQIDADIEELYGIAPGEERMWPAKPACLPQHPGHPAVFASISSSMGDEEWPQATSGGGFGSLLRLDSPGDFLRYPDAPAPDVSPVSNGAGVR